MTIKRLLGGFVLPALLFGLAVVPCLVLRDRLPDPLATHWDWHGEADGSMSPGVLLGIVGALSGLGGLALAVLAVAPPMQRGARSAVAATCGGITALFAGISMLTVAANLDVSTWRDAKIDTLNVIAMCLAAVIIGALAGYLLRRNDDISAGAEPSRLPTAGVGIGQRAAWLGGCQSKWMYALGAGLLIVGLIAGAFTELMLSVAMAVSALAVMALGSIRVATNQRGLTVFYTPLAWPRTQVPLERIVAAEAIDVSPMKHGGWGYRGSLKVFGMAAVVLRKGEGIRLELDNGKLFIVTVDDAHTGAGVLNDLLGVSTPA